MAVVVVKGNIRGLEGVKVTLKDFDTGAVVGTIHSTKDGWWEFPRPATGKYNIVFTGRGTSSTDNLYGVEVVDMSEFESSEQFLNDTIPGGEFADVGTPISEVTNRLQSRVTVEWAYTQHDTNKAQGFVLRWEHGESSGQEVTTASPSRVLDSTTRKTSIEIPSDDYITLKIYAFFNGISGANEDDGYQHDADWVDHHPEDLASLSGWDANSGYLQGGNAKLHSDGYLELGTDNGDYARIDAGHATYRIWAGHTVPASAPFSVAKDGAMVAAGGEAVFNADGSGSLGTNAISWTAAGVVDVAGWIASAGIFEKKAGTVGITLDSTGPTITLGDTAAQHMILSGSDGKMEWYDTANQLVVQIDDSLVSSAAGIRVSDGGKAFGAFSNEGLTIITSGGIQLFDDTVSAVMTDFRASHTFPGGDTISYNFLSWSPDLDNYGYSRTNMKITSRMVNASSTAALYGLRIVQEQKGTGASWALEVTGDAGDANVYIQDGLLLGTTNTLVTNGTIQWTGSDFQGRVGGAWKSFTGIDGTGVFKSGIPSDNQIAVWKSSTQIEGQSDLTWNSLVLAVGGLVTWTGGGSSNANTAYGWGDHGGEGYITATLTTEEVQDISGALIATGGTKTGIAIIYQDGTNDMDFVVDHDAANNFVDGEHILHSGVDIVAGAGMTGGGAIDASQTLNVIAGTGITVNADDVQTNDGQIVHDNLSGFVGNEHINHTSVAVTVGTGLDLTGSSDISASFNINLDLTEVIATDAANRVLTSDGDGTLTAESGLTYSASVLGVTGNVNISGDYLLANGNYIGISAAERLEFYTAGYAAFMGCNVGIGTSGPDTLLHLVYNSSTVHANGPNEIGLQVENTNTDTNTYSQIILRSASSDHYIRNIYTGAANTGDLAFLLDNGSQPTEKMRITSAGNVGIGTSIGIDYLLTLADQGDMGNPSFSSSIFTGSGWALQYETNRLVGGSGLNTGYHLALDHLTVRGTFSIYELLIQQIRATNGSVFVTAAGKVESKFSGTWSVGQSVILQLEDNSPFAPGDLLRAKRIEVNSSGTSITSFLVECTVTATDFTNKRITVTLNTLSGTATSEDVAESLELVRLGNTTDAGRRGSIYLTSDDSDAPFMEFIDEVDSFADFVTAATRKMRLGNLVGSGYSDYTSGNYPNGLYGFAAGDSTAQYLTIDPTNGIRILDGSESDNVLLQASGDLLTVGDNFVYTSSSQILLVAGWTVNPTAIEGGNVKLDKDGIISLGTGTIGHGNAKMIYLDGSGDGLFSVGTNFVYTGGVTDTLLVAGWTVNSSTITGGNTVLNSSGVLSLGTGTIGYGNADMIYLDGSGDGRFSIGESFGYTGNVLTVAGWTVSSSRIIGGNTVLNSSGILTLGSGATNYAAANMIYLDGSGAGRFSVGVNFKYASNILTVGDWTINSSTITGGNATLNSSGVLSLGTGTIGYGNADMIYIDGSGAGRFSIGENFGYTGDVLTVGGWTVTTSTLENLSSNKGIMLDSTNGAEKIQVGDLDEQHIDILGADGSVVWYKSDGAGGSTEVVRIDDDVDGTNAGIKITGQDTRLYLWMNSTNHNSFTRAGMFLTSAGNLGKYTAYEMELPAMFGTGTSGTPLHWRASDGKIWRFTSSERYKTDIAPLEIKTDVIYGLSVKSYTSKADGVRTFGLIAEDVYKVSPDIVNLDNENRPDSIKEPLLSYMMLEELKKLRREVDVLIADKEAA